MCSAASMAGVRNPDEFDVWKLAWELKRRVYAFTAIPPASKDRGFCDDIRRAARSGSDLVVEGFYRYNPREFHRFLNDAKGSLGEVRNQLRHAVDEQLLTETESRAMFSLAGRAIGAANGLQKYLRSCPRKFERPRQSRNEPSQNRRRIHQNGAPQNPEPRTVPKSTLHQF